MTARINDTDIIDEVARRFANGMDHGANMVAAYVLNWSRHSGNAHGMRWPLLAGADIIRDDTVGTHARVLVKVFVRDREITDIVRVEIGNRDEELLGVLGAG